MRPRSTSSSSVDGPMVQTTLVLFFAAFSYAFMVSLLSFSRLHRKDPPRKTIGSEIGKGCCKTSLHAQSNLSITLLLKPTQHTEKNDQNVTLPAENVTLPAENVTLPAENVTLPTENVTPQAETVTAIPCYDDSTDDTENGKMKPQKKTKEENPPAPPKEKNKRKNSHSYARVSQQNLETRREAFIDSLAAFSSIYGNEMLQAFADYWTEPNRSLTRMRFEMQKTWSTALRLATWARNEASFGQRRCSQPRFTTADYIRDAQQYAMEQAMLVLRRAEEKRQLRQLL